MKDLRVKEIEKTKRKSKWKFKLINFWRKRKWWILSTILISLIIIFPETSGQTIGQFIHDFVGNLVKFSKF
jgi:uncharacterized membrane protein